MVGVSAAELEARARGFARALDADDLAAARPYLDSDCHYQLRDETLRGPDAILESYRRASRMAQELFDDVAYASRVLAVKGDTAVVHYEDILTLDGETHVHNVRQRLAFGGDGLIAYIEHEDLPGERERLERFLARFGKTLE